MAGLWGLASPLSTPNPSQEPARGQPGTNSASKSNKEETPRKFQRVVNGKGGKGKGPDKKRQEPSADGDPHWEGRHPPSEFQLLKTLVLRHEHSLRQLAVDRGYVLFFSTSDMSTLTLLKEVTNHWQKSYQEKKTTTTLRTALLTSLWMELEARRRRSSTWTRDTCISTPQGGHTQRGTRTSSSPFPRMRLR